MQPHFYGVKTIQALRLIGLNKLRRHIAAGRAHGRAFRGLPAGPLHIHVEMRRTDAAAIAGLHDNIARQAGHAIIAEPIKTLIGAKG